MIETVFVMIVLGWLGGTCYLIGNERGRTLGQDEAFRMCEREAKALRAENVELRNALARLGGGAS